MIMKKFIALILAILLIMLLLVLFGSIVAPQLLDTVASLAGSVMKKNLLCYDDLGTYQIICNIKNPEIVCNPFMKQTLGKLYEYDSKGSGNRKI